MRSKFSFRSLIERVANVEVPKEFIGLGIGLIVIIMLGLIASNMYLQEMLFFEGVEKTLPFFTEEELREYGELYKNLSRDFQSQIGAYCQDYAKARNDNGNGYKYLVNRAGEKIHYGIYNHEHPEGNGELIHPHENGTNKYKTDEERDPDNDDSYNEFEVDYSYIDTDEYKNGVKIKYSNTNGKIDGEDNFQDILTVVSMLLDQNQTDDTYKNTKDMKSKVPNMIKNLFKMSHTYVGSSTELYPCEMGCRVLFYYCNEVDNEYKSTGKDLQPFQIEEHDKLGNYGYDLGEDCFEVVDPIDECEVCGHEGKGCEKDEAKCYHGAEGEGEGGDDGEDYGPHFLGLGKKEKYADKCSNIDEKNECSHECD